jgi:hypothetical protein
MAVKLQIRRDTAVNWTTANPLISQGEICFEIDTYKVKIGTGLVHWNDLPDFAATPTASAFIVNSTAGNETTKAASVAAMKSYVTAQIAANAPKQVVEYITLTNTNISNKSVTLMHTPKASSDVVVDIIGGGPQEYSQDYTVTGTSLSWLGKALDGTLSVGERIRVIYSYL